MPASPRGRTPHLLLLAALAAGGCAQYQPAPLDPAAMLQTLQSRRLDDPALQARLARQLHRSIPPWDLPALQAVAVELNPQLQAARAAHEVARAAAAVATQRPVPSLHIPLGYTTNPRPGESPYTVGIGLDVPIETGSKREARSQQAEQAAAAAAWDAQAQAWQLRARLRDQLLDLWSSRRQAAGLQREVAHREDLLRLVEHRLQQGAATSHELYLARSELQQARRSLLDAGRRSGQALAAAAGTIGVATPALAAADLQLDAFATPPARLPRAVDRPALAQRADVQAALARYDAAQAGLQLAIARQYPDIRIGPGYTFDAGAHKIALSLTELPLLLLRDQRPLIAEAVARRGQAGAQLQQAVAQALDGMEGALAAMEAARGAFDAAQVQLSLQQRTMQATRHAFDAGAVDRPALALAQIQLDRAGVDHETALQDLQKAAGALELAWQQQETAADARAGKDRP